MLIYIILTHNWEWYCVRFGISFDIACMTWVISGLLSCHLKFREVEGIPKYGCTFCRTKLWFEMNICMSGFWTISFPYQITVKASSGGEDSAYIMEPCYFVRWWIGNNGTFKVNIISFFKVIEIQSFSYMKTNCRRNWNTRKVLFSFLHASNTVDS